MAQREKLVEKLRDFDLLFKHSSEVVVIFDKALKIIYQNPPARELFSDHTGEPRFMAFGGRGVGESLTERVLRTGEPCAAEHEVFDKRGVKGLWKVSASPIKDENGDTLAVLEIARCVSEGRQPVVGETPFGEAGEGLGMELTRTEEYLNSLVRNMRDALIVTDLNNRIQVWNEGAEQLYGFSGDEVLGRDSAAVGIIPPGRLERDREIKERVIRETADITFETKRLKKDGGEIDVLVTFSPLIMSDGETVGTIAVHKDITDTKRLEEEKRKAMEVLENLIGSAGDAIISTNIGWEVVTWNTGAERMYGQRKEDVLGKDFFSIGLLSEPEKGQLTEKSRLVRERGDTVTFESTRRRKDGFLVNVLITLSPLRDSEGKHVGYIGVHKDITDRKRMEEQLIQFEKLSALEEMISGIAHEMNNPMTGILGYSQLLQGADCSPEMKRDLEMLHREALRCQNIVKSLMRFARKEKGERTAIQINDIIRSTLELIRYNLYLDSVSVTTQLDGSVPPILGDGDQLQQMILNIVINAHHAVLQARGSRELRIRTECDRSRGVVQAIFQDTGVGMTAEVKNRVFDPFFTTKRHKGTGLGLSASYGIAKAHGGDILVESVEGKGTTVTVQIPYGVGEEGIGQEVMKEAEPKGEVRGTVMIVDDEEVIRELLEEILTDEGYVVEAFPDAREALDRFEVLRHQCILLDIRMPGMDGREFYSRITALDPSTANRIIFITGDTLSPFVDGFLKTDRKNYLTKPLDIKELKEEVRRVMARVSAA